MLQLTIFTSITHNIFFSKWIWKTLCNLSHSLGPLKIFQRWSQVPEQGSHMHSAVQRKNPFCAISALREVLQEGMFSVRSLPGIWELVFRFDICTYAYQIWNTFLGPGQTAHRAFSHARILLGRKWHIMGSSFAWQSLSSQTLFNLNHCWIWIAYPTAHVLWKQIKSLAQIHEHHKHHGQGHIQGAQGSRLLPEW